MLDDIRVVSRQLLKSPGFTVLAVMILAQGIGLSTAVFSLVNDLFLRGLPFVEPQQIVRLYAESKNLDIKNFPLSAPRFFHYRDGQSIFAGFAAERNTSVTLTGMGDPVQMAGRAVTWNYFDVLGVHPIRGRNFLPPEEEAADVALISESLWRRQFGSTPDILGRSIVLNGVPHSIVGVLPTPPVAWFGPDDVEVWTTKPFVIPGMSRERLMRGTGFLRVIGRLKSGTTIDQARAGLPSLEHSYRTQFPETVDNSLTISIVSLPEDVTGNLRPAFGIVVAAVAVILVIACINVAGLLLVRFSGRRKEIAIRVALGASRKNVLRLFMLESLLVSVIAGLVGAIVAWVVIPLVPKMAANYLPLDANVTLSYPALAFAAALALLMGFLIGVYSASQSLEINLAENLKEGGRGASGSIRQQRSRKILAGAQVALSITLLATAALLIASFIRLSRQNIGFRPTGLWIGGVTLPRTRYPDIPARQRFVDQLLAKLRPTQGFQSVSVSSDIPLDGATDVLYSPSDGNLLPVHQRSAAPEHDVAPGYFATWGIPIVAGRDFDEHDLEGTPNVILISQSGAQKIFGPENPIGRTLLITSASISAEIIGIIGDVRSRHPAQRNDMELYRPWAQESFQSFRVAVRSGFEPQNVAKLVQTALRTIDPSLAISEPGGFGEIMGKALGQARLLMVLLGTFAGVALLFATVGIYGSVAFMVEQRTAEIGVRMALGAQTRDVIRLVVVQGMKPVVIGLAVGLAAALAVGRLLMSQLYQISPYNPLLLIATVALLCIASMLACLFPAQRASSVDPIRALRME